MASHKFDALSLKATLARAVDLQARARLTVARARAIIKKARNVRLNRRRALQESSPRELLSSLREIERLMRRPDAPGHIRQATAILVAAAQRLPHQSTLRNLVIHLLNVIDDVADKGRSASVRNSNVANALKELRAAIGTAARAEFNDPTLFGQRSHR